MTSIAPTESTHWYVVSITSGYEQSIKNTIETTQALKNIYKKAFIPCMSAKRFYKNKFYHYSDKVYPGYVFIECQTKDFEEIFSHIAIIPGILNMSHFKEIRRIAYPITDKEMAGIVGTVFDKSDKYVNNEYKHIEVNQKVKIIEGPFSNFEGIVTEINHSKSKETRLKVCAAFFQAGGDISNIVVNASQVQLI